MGYSLGPSEKNKKTDIRYQIVEVSLLHEKSIIICAYARNEFEAARQHADRLATAARRQGRDGVSFQVEDLLGQRSPYSPYIGQAPISEKD